MQTVTTKVPAVRVYLGRVGSRFHLAGHYYFSPMGYVGSYPFSEPYPSLREAFEAGLQFRLAAMEGDER